MLNAIHNSEKFGSIQVDYKQSEITKNVYEVYGAAFFKVVVASTV